VILKNMEPAFHALRFKWSVIPCKSKLKIQILR
jgi:hypothetical protein